MGVFHLIATDCPTTPRTRESGYTIVVYNATSLFVPIQLCFNLNLPDLSEDIY